MTDIAFVTKQTSDRLVIWKLVSLVSLALHRRVEVVSSKGVVGLAI